MQTLCGERQTVIIKESDLYRKPRAREFKRSSTREVIPSIRKRGMYIAPNMPDGTSTYSEVFERFLDKHQSS